MRNLLKGLGGSTPAPKPQPAPTIDRMRLDLLDQFERTGTLWLWATDAEGRLTYISDGAKQKFREGTNLIGEPLTALVTVESGIDGQKDARPLSFLLSTHTKFVDLPVKVVRPGTEMRWTLGGQPEFDEEGTFLGYRGNARDFTEEFDRKLSDSRAAEFDSLTGLPNRTQLSKRLTGLLNACKSAERSCALLLIDLDRFKQVNDTLGHNAGDELLKQVAQRLERMVDEKWVVGRRGGDEFQVSIPDIDDRGELGSLGQRVCQMLAQPYSIDGKRAIIGASIGIAIAPYDGVEAEELVLNAELALYAAKNEGRGRYRFYSNELQDKAQLERQIEEELRDALAQGQLEMYYQPVVSAKTNRVAGFEALMRWEHPERGMVSPAIFIPVAEETGLIGALGEWALRQACMDAAQWPGDLRVAVNVSAHQFDSGNLPKLVSNALANSGLEASRLELEITESVYMGDADTVDEMFARLKKIGVRLALDDFGTGYSSLGYLRNVPFDKIKIDQCFVRGCTEEGNANSAIIAAIVSLAEALGLETTAEGVEAMDQLELVRQRGATYVQGFIYSRPVTQAVVMDKLAMHNFTYEPAGPRNSRSNRRRLYRRVGVIHEDYRYQAVLRDLSKTGARIEGILDVPVGTELVLDLGEGQLVVCAVRRSQDATQGVEFETPLISDGADGLCTRHRVSPYRLAAAGMPLSALPAGHYPLVDSAGQPTSGRARFLQVDIGSGSSRAA